MLNRVSSGEKYFFMFMMVMWVARTTPLTSFKIGENPILTPVYLLILLYYYVRYCKLTNIPLYCLLSIYASWYVCICLKYGGIQGVEFTFLYSFIIVHIAFNIYNKTEFLSIFENVIVKLCILSLIVWAAANILPGFPKIMHSIAVYENHPPTETNSIIVGMGSQISMGIRRNIGFTWEPGRFSCFIIMTMFFNLIRTKFQLKGNINMLILLVTLLSTISTTGYFALIAIILFYLINTTTNSKFLTTIIISLFLPSFVGLSFMMDKVVGLSDIDTEISAINYFGNRGMEVVCPQRIASLYFEYINLIHDFWFGFNNIENSYINNHLFKGVLVTSSQGVLIILSKYGILFGSFFYFCLFRSTTFLSKVYHYKGKYMFAFVFILISVSYEFWGNCIWMYFYLSVFYTSFSNKYYLLDLNLQRRLALLFNKRSIGN